MLYQPTDEELARLNQGMNSTPQAPFYERAREILRDVNRNLGWQHQSLGGWIVRSQSPNAKDDWYTINTRFEPPVCACASYQSDPARPDNAHIFLPGPTGRMFIRRQCKHTITYMGYRLILAEHCSKLPGGAVPRHIPLTMAQGLIQPKNAQALWTFAHWLTLYLADPVKVTRIAQETWDPSRVHLPH